MKRGFYIIAIAFLASCSSETETESNLNNQPDNTILEATLITEQVGYDTDDPAIWINTNNTEESLVIGTDKDSDGGLFVFDLKGKIVNKVKGLKRPNNVDIAYGIMLKGEKKDIAIVTERETNKIRIFSLPDLKPLDNGGIAVFEGEKEKAPMGVAIYTRPSDAQIFVIVGRKTGPSGTYLWQYQLSDDGTGNIAANVVRKFGNYSGKKEIESIAVDNELGYVYYSDEQYGIHKYLADPNNGNEELVVFGQSDFTDDVEGISIYKHADGTGYILVSNQQDNSFNIYPREGTAGEKDNHKMITNIPVSAIESDGSDVINIALGSQFPNGLFVAMDNRKTFHFFDWRKIQERIDQVK